MSKELTPKDLETLETGQHVRLQIDVQLRFDNSLNKKQIAQLLQSGVLQMFQENDLKFNNVRYIECGYHLDQPWKSIKTS